MGLRHRLACAGALAALVAAAPAANAAPAPFGHACAPSDGVRVCPTTDLAQRVPSFDGVPLDVDVTLPAQGDGPFPTLLLLHGLGGTKTDFEGAGREPGYNSVFFAKRGYAVVTPTQRGFGRSCGTVASRTAGCERGWTHLADMRYEVRDMQTLLGRLVDDGTTRPDAIGTTGISYGGGTSMMLAFLRDRIRTADGGFAPWTSPAGTRIALTAAWPRWPWSNGESIFTRNGRGVWSRTPVGVEVKAYAGGIFAVPQLAGFVAPPGADPTADLTRWKALLDAGRFGPDAQAVLDNAYREHGVASIAGSSKPAPLLLQSGWTDALFPVGQVLAPYDFLRRGDHRAPVALQLGDLGHAPGANHPVDIARFDAQGLAFLDAHLLGRGSPPAPGTVTATRMICPKRAASGGTPYTASSFAGLSRARLTISAHGRFTIDEKGASRTLAAALSPLSKSGGDQCTTYPVDRTSRAMFGVHTRGMTMIGLPEVSGRVTARGRYGQIDARVWDRDPATGRRRLITRGTYRLAVNQKGAFRFALDGNAYRFAAGHGFFLELLGRDDPTYGASPEPFTAKLSSLRIAVPLRSTVPGLPVG